MALRRGTDSERPAPPRALRCRSLIGGAHRDHQFEAGDTVTVPADKYDEWLAAGCIAPADTKGDE